MSARTIYDVDVVDVDAGELVERFGYFVVLEIGPIELWRRAMVFLACVPDGNQHLLEELMIFAEKNLLNELPGGVVSGIDDT